MKYCRYIGLI